MTTRSRLELFVLLKRDLQRIENAMNDPASPQWEISFDKFVADKVNRTLRKRYTVRFSKDFWKDMIQFLDDEAFVGVLEALCVENDCSLQDANAAVFEAFNSICDAIGALPRDAFEDVVPITVFNKTIAAVRWKRQFGHATVTEVFCVQPNI